MARALLLLALCWAGCGAAGVRRLDDEYGGAGMPHYDDYEGSEPAPRRSAGGAGDAGDAGDAYPERDPHSLDYKYDEEQPRGRNDRSYYTKQSKASKKRNRNKKSRKTTANFYIDFESSKYNNDDTFDKITPVYKREYYSESGNKGRNKKRRSGVNELSGRTSSKFSRKRAEDPEEHPNAQDPDEPESRLHGLLDPEDDESQYSNKMTTRRKNRRIPRDKSEASSKTSGDTGENSEHRQRPARTDVRRREMGRKNTRGRKEDVEEDEETTSSAAKTPNLGKRQLNQEPEDFLNEDVRLDEIARGPQAGAVTEVAPPTRAGQEQPGGDYEEYNIDVETMARRRAMLERVLGGRPTTEPADDTDATPEILLEPPSPPPPTLTTLSTTTTEASPIALSELTTAGGLVTRTSSATKAAIAIVTDTTPTLIAQATDEPRELSIAEKSRLSILKKSQKKDSLKDSILMKPAVLRQVTLATTGPGGRRAGAGMVSAAMPSSTQRFALVEQQAESDTPELLSRVKSIMRQRLVSRARSLRELTDNWDAVVCEYVDDALLRAPGTPLASRTPRSSAPAALLFCAALLVSAAC